MALIIEFDTWQPGYGLATVSIYVAGTTTLADVFTDEALTVEADNPQTLAESIIDDISFGKFAAPLYVGTAYQLQINDVDTTGIVRPPLTTLAGADASTAVVTPTGGTEEISLADLAALEDNVRDYGEFIAVGDVGASASTNNATLVAAIAAAAAAGGGFVEVPAGTYLVTAFTVPQGVVLRGQGRGITILQSTTAGTVVTIGGTYAGFTRITLDGVSQVALSIGVLAINKDNIVFDDAEVKRFETGIQRKGGSLSYWRELYISDCVNGYLAYGDSAAGAGGSLRFNSWSGGTVDTCTTKGIEYKNVDATCEQNILDKVTFDSNTGIALNIIGARALMQRDCQWINNTADIKVADGSPVTTNNTVIGLEFVGGEIDGGTIEFSDTYSGVFFRRMTLVSPTITLNASAQNIIAEDCRISNPTIAGVPTCWLYHSTGLRGSSFVITSDNSAHKAWALTLKSGEKIYLEGKVIGRQRNGINTGFYHVSVSAGRVGAALAYDTQSANFTAGQVLTGGTSGATARITADADGGTTGTLTLQDIIGTFVDNEAITDPLGGAALANGTIVESDAALIGSVTAIRAAQETDSGWNATFVANGPQIELQVTGNSALTVEWSVDVDITRDQGSPIIIAQAAGIFVHYHGKSGTVFPGTIVRGVTSGAQGVIQSDSGTVLTLSSLSGTFISGEAIFEPVFHTFTAVVD